MSGLTRLLPLEVKDEIVLYRILEGGGIYVAAFLHFSFF